ncbi:MAG: hypothetical protein AAFU85_15110 [Planctomycetota bacterium]
MRRCLEDDVKCEDGKGHVDAAVVTLNLLREQYSPAVSTKQFPPLQEDLVGALDHLATGLEEYPDAGFYAGMVRRWIDRTQDKNLGYRS